MHLPLVIQKLVESVSSEGKLIFDSNGNLLAQNRFVTDLDSQMGENVLLSSISGFLSDKSCGIWSFEGNVFSRICLDGFTIITVQKSGGDTCSESCAFASGLSPGEDIETLDVGYCEFRLDTWTGVSVGIRVNSKYVELVGVSRDTIISHGIPAVGNRVHPEDLMISDVISKSIIARKSRGGWPLRIYVDSEYKWRRYEINIISEEPDNDQYVLMEVILADFTKEADDMGLVSTPGVKVLDMGQGNVRHIPIVHAPTATEATRTVTSPTHGDFASSVATCDGADSELTSDDGNIMCMKRCLAMRLSQSVSLVMNTGDPKTMLQIAYIPLDLDYLVEEISLSMKSGEANAAFIEAVDTRNYLRCASILGAWMGIDSNWFETLTPFSVSSDKLTVAMKFLLALASHLSPAEAVALLRTLRTHVSVLSELGGAPLGHLMSVEIALSLLSVVVKERGSVARANYTWMAEFVGSVLDAIDEFSSQNTDGLILQGAHWVGIKWAYFHAVILANRQELSIGILESSLADIKEYTIDFPHSKTAHKLQKIIISNIEHISMSKPYTPKVRKAPLF